MERHRLGERESERGREGERELGSVPRQRLPLSPSPTLPLAVNTITRGEADESNDQRGSTAIVSVVFSFFNEEEVLPELLRRTRSIFAELIADGEIGGYELIFVNDASTDGSKEMLCREICEQSDVRLINMSRNFGVSPCVLAGMLYARGDAVVYMDADLQDPPEVIPELVRVWKSDTSIDVVHTVRRRRTGESLFKLALTRLGYGVLRAVSSIDLPMEAGDFKLLSRRAVELVTQFNEKRPFLRGLVCWIGLEQAKVYYDRQPRHGGKSKFNVLGIKVIRNFLDSALISFSDLPLKMTGVLGVVLAAIAVCQLLWLFATGLVGGFVPGWLAVLGAVLFVGGVQLISIGVLGSYVASIFLESKGRPNFIVRDCLGFDLDRTCHSAEATCGS